MLQLVFYITSVWQLFIKILWKNIFILNVKHFRQCKYLKRDALVPLGLTLMAGFLFFIYFYTLQDNHFSCVFNYDLKKSFFDKKFCDIQSGQS